MKFNKLSVKLCLKYKDVIKINSIIEKNMANIIATPRYLIYL